MKKIKVTLVSIWGALVVCCDTVKDILTGKPTTVKAIKKNIEVNKVAVQKLKAQRAESILKLNTEAHDIINDADKEFNKVDENKQKMLDSVEATALINKENVQVKKNQQLWNNMNKAHDLDREVVELAELEGKL